jgi:hypothetical protein
MFSLNDSMRYWLYPYPADMRKSFYTLSGIVSDRMGGDVRSGDVFIFINRPCTGMKLLHMESGGLVIYHLKLEAGTFRLPIIDDSNQTTYPITWSHLVLMVQGIDPQKCTQRKRWKNPKLL